MIVILKPGENEATVIGYHHALDRTVLDATLYDGADGAPRLLMALLRHRHRDPEQLIAWARGLRTTQGTIFINEGAVWQGDEDMTHLLLISSDQALAAAYDGTVITIDLRQASSEILVAGDGKRIVALASGLWP
jgi:hypothetical protein